MPIIADLYVAVHDRGESGVSALTLIHGAGGTHLNWPPELRRISGRTVYAPDLPGHGKSEGPGLQTVKAYAERIVDLLRALDARQVVLVGHSMGGAIAMELYLQAPERIAALVLIGSGAQLPVNPQLLEWTASPTTFPLAVERITTWSHGPGADPALLELGRKTMLRTRPSVFHGDLKACQGFNLAERLGEIACPALVLYGSRDRMTPPRLSQYLTAHLPDGRQEVIPEAGHMVILENPLAVASAVETFLEGQGL
jgi:pimeloyl-ACP methyl ester carboxylesterase